MRITQSAPNFLAALRLTHRILIPRVQLAGVTTMALGSSVKEGEARGSMERHLPNCSSLLPAVLCTMQSVHVPSVGS